MMKLTSYIAIFIVVIERVPICDPLNNGTRVANAILKAYVQTQKWARMQASQTNRKVRYRIESCDYVTYINIRYYIRTELPHLIWTARFLFKPFLCNTMPLSELKLSCSNIQPPSLFLEKKKKCIGKLWSHFRIPQTIHAL